MAQTEMTELISKFHDLQGKRGGTIGKALLEIYDLLLVEATEEVKRLEVSNLTSEEKKKQLRWIGKKMLAKFNTLRSNVRSNFAQQKCFHIDPEILRSKMKATIPAVYAMLGKKREAEVIEEKTTAEKPKGPRVWQLRRSKKNGRMVLSGL